MKWLSATSFGYKFNMQLSLVSHITMAKLKLNLLHMENKEELLLDSPDPLFNTKRLCLMHWYNFAS